MELRITKPARHDGVGPVLDAAADHADARNNCMFQLCLMLARVAVGEVDEAYKQMAAQRLLAILRDKPANNVVSLFPKPAARETAVQAELTAS